MHIAIDLRSLSSGSVSGVENYTLNLLEHLLRMDKKNTYTLYYNSWHAHPVGDFHFINAKTKETHWPNKILNLALKSKIINLEKFTGDFDCLFMPNLNQFNIRPQSKLALTVHDLSPIITPEFYDVKRKLWHKFLNYKKAFERANLIFAVSEYTKTDLLRLFKVPKTKIKVVYPGIDENIFKPDIETSRLREVRNYYSLPGDYLLFLNTIEPRKNLTNLVKAFDLLKSDVNLVIVGKTGWKYRQIFRDIRKSAKFGKIKYIGYMQEKDKPATIGLAKVLVYPSLYEGFGFQPLEAAACGVPSVVSQLTSLPEVMADSSFLVNPYNPLELAQALDLVLRNEQLRVKLIEKGKQRVRQFTWQKTAQLILEGLNQI